MIFDRTTLFSDGQPVSGNAVSTNVIDLAPISKDIRRDVGKGRPVPILIQVVDDYVGAGTVSVEIEVADDEAFTVNKAVIGKTPTYDGGVLKAGFVFGLESVPRGVKVGKTGRYVRIAYKASGTFTKTGKITAGITMGNQSND